MIDTIEFDIKPSRIAVKLPKRRIYMPIKRADTFGDKRKKRIRTRQAKSQKYIREMDNA